MLNSQKIVLFSLRLMALVRSSVAAVAKVGQKNQKNRPTLATAATSERTSAIKRQFLTTLRFCWTCAIEQYQIHSITFKYYWKLNNKFYFTLLFTNACYFSISPFILSPINLKIQQQFLFTIWRPRCTLPPPYSPAPQIHAYHVLSPAGENWKFPKP